MSHLPKILNALSKLLSYPDDSTVQTSELLYVLLMEELPEAASEAAAFGSYLEQHDLHEVEESFTRVFDVNPACALEVGWHLFGEEYARGMFLVRMREELRKYDLPESVELTDHLCHVLAIVAVMPDREATRFVKACVQPAVSKMAKALQDKETPYRHIMRCLVLMLAYTWGEVLEEDEDPSEQSGDLLQRFKSDPLQSYPVADVGCEEPMQLVTLKSSAALLSSQSGGARE